MASAGTVTLNLDANSVKMIRELQKAQRTTKRSSARMRQDFVRAFKGISVAAGAAAASMALMTKKAVDFADSIGKTADRIGISTTSLQELRFAAEQTGVDMNQFEQALTALVRRQGEAVAGNKEFGKGFERLGISIQELNGMDADELLNRVADGLQRLPDQASRIAALDRVMSEAGRRIINVFGDGAASLQEFRDQAQSLGIVIEERLLRQAEEVADKMNILSTVVRTQVASAFLELAPAIVTVTDYLTDAATAAGEFGEESESGSGQVIRSFAFVMDAATGAYRAFQVWGRSLAVLFASIRLGMMQVRDSIINGPGAAMDWVIRQANQIPGVDVEFQFGPVLPDLREDIALAKGIIAEGVADIHEILMQPLPGADLIARFEEVRDRMRQEAEKIKAPVVVPGVTPPVAPTGTVGTDGEPTAAAAAALERYKNLQREVQRALEDSYTPAQRFVNEMIRLAMLERNGLTTEAADRLRQQAAERFAASADDAKDTMDQMTVFAEQAARNMQDALADFLFDPFSDGLDGMLRGFIDTLRRMVAEAAAAKIFESMGGIEGIGSSIAGIFGGGLASGGPTYPGKAYLVGEEGPELVVPGRAHVVPNEALHGGAAEYQRRHA